MKPEEWRAIEKQLFFKIWPELKIANFLITILQIFCDSIFFEILDFDRNNLFIHLCFLFLRMMSSFTFLSFHVTYLYKIAFTHMFNCMVSYLWVCWLWNIQPNNVFLGNVHSTIKLTGFRCSNDLSVIFLFCFCLLNMWK